jgi:hypothetical protein
MTETLQTKRLENMQVYSTGVHLTGLYLPTSGVIQRRMIQHNGL